MKEYLFTYGTLRLSYEHPMAKELTENSHLFSLGYIKNAKLYRVDWYPALVQSELESDIVVGDVFELHNTAILKRLDEYEGIHLNDTFEEYRREKIKVYTDNEIIDCWIYMYNVCLPDNAIQIKSGDFLNP
jgi:gamma-glutamylcyclotransferase (GGCT)/AIG2-like uncharacterized protein YtfP